MRRFSRASRRSKLRSNREGVIPIRSSASHLISFLLFVGVLLLAGAAHAVCSNPSGDAGKITDILKAKGPLEVFDADGKPVK